MLRKTSGTILVICVATIVIFHFQSLFGILQALTNTPHTGEFSYFIGDLIDKSHPSLVCPVSKYMGLTNILVNMIDCMLLAVTLCNRSRVYFPLQIQHATFFDLFNVSVVGSLEKNLGVRIFFYDSELRRDIPILRTARLADFFDVNFACALHPSGPLLVLDAYSLDYFESQKVLPYLKVFSEHPANGILQHMKNVQHGLNYRYVGVHIRFESDTQMLTGKVLSIADWFNNVIVPLHKRLQKNSKYSPLPWYGTGDKISVTSLNVTMPVFRSKNELIHLD
jgi:hypothetical protein